MGSIFSYFQATTKEEDENLDVLDPKTNLTLRQKNAMRRTWEIVKKDIRGNGVLFFMEFFRAHPEYQKAFRGFRDVPFDELKDNKKLHAHAFGVMYALTSYVDNLDDIDTLVNILLKTGRDHSRRKITIEQFDNLAIVFLNFMEKQLGEHWDQLAKDSWATALKVINSVIEKGLVEKEEPED